MFRTVFPAPHQADRRLRIVPGRQCAAQILWNADDTSICSSRAESRCPVKSSRCCFSTDCNAGTRTQLLRQTTLARTQLDVELRLPARLARRWTTGHDAPFGPGVCLVIAEVAADGMEHFTKLARQQHQDVVTNQVHPAPDYRRFGH